MSVHRARRPFDRVVFDLDGTLVDSARDLADAVNDVLGALDRPTHSVDAIRAMVGHGAAALLERALGERDPALVARARARFEVAYGARLTVHTRLYAGLREVLRALSEAGVEVSVATNKPATFTERLAAALDLAGAGVVAVASSDETPAKKPDPSVVRLALARAQRAAPRRETGATDGERTVYVGDMAIDVETARRLPCPSLGVGWGFDPAGLRAAAPDLWAETPDALRALLLPRG